MKPASKDMIKGFPRCNHPKFIEGHRDQLLCNADRCLFALSEGDVEGTEWGEVDKLLIGSYMHLQCLKASEEAMGSDWDASIAFRELAISWRRWGGIDD